MHVARALARSRTFRGPTLRKVELTAPYMHDGRCATLEDVIEHHALAGVMGSNADAAICRLGLAAEEKLALIECLRSLTDREFVTRDWARCSAPLPRTEASARPRLSPAARFAHGRIALQHGDLLTALQTLDAAHDHDIARRHGAAHGDEIAVGGD